MPLILVALCLCGGAASHALAARPHSGASKGARSLRRTERQLGRLAQLAAAKDVRTKIEAVVNTPAIPGFSRALLSSNRDSLTPTRRGLLELDLLLDSSQFDATHAFAQLAHNPAIVALRRRGEYLRQHPVLIKAVWSRMVGRDTPAAQRGEPRQSPVGIAASAVHDPIAALGGKTFSNAAKDVLSGPAGLAYLRALPPVALASLLPSGRAAAERPTTLGLSGRASISSATICNTAGFWPAQETLYKFLGSWLIGEKLDDLERAAGRRGIKQAAYELAGPTYAKASKTWARRAVRAFTVGGEIINGMELGEGAMEAAWNAIVKCGAKSIEIVPNPMTRRAGEKQSYSLLAKDEYGRDWGGITPDTLAINDGVCSAKGQWCESTVSGGHIVEATFGAVYASAELKIKPGPLAHLQLNPSSATIQLGETSPAYSAVGKDGYGNRVPVELGAGPAQLRLSISPDGSCNDVTRACTPAAPGPHQVRLAYGGEPAANASSALEVKDDKEEPGGGGLHWTGSIFYSAEWADDDTPEIGREFRGLPLLYPQANGTWTVDEPEGAEGVAGAGALLPLSYEVDRHEYAQPYEFCGPSESRGYSLFINATGVGREGFGIYIYPNDYAVQLDAPPSSLFWTGYSSCNGDPEQGEEEVDFDRIVPDCISGVHAGAPLSREGTKVSGKITIHEGTNACLDASNLGDAYVDVRLRAVCPDGGAPTSTWTCPGQVGSGGNQARMARAVAGPARI